MAAVCSEAGLPVEPSKTIDPATDHNISGHHIGVPLLQQFFECCQEALSLLPENLILCAESASCYP